MAPLTSEQVVSLEKLISEHGLDAARDKIVELAQSAIFLETSKPDDYSRVGNSRLGGVPDLPPDMDWPSEEDYPDPDAAGDDDDMVDVYLIFVAQINLGEMPHLIQSPLPDHGMLYFFIASTEEASGVYHKVLYYGDDMSRLATRQHPRPEHSYRIDGEVPDYKPYRIAATLAISTPHYGMFGNPEFKQLGLEDSPDGDLTDLYFELQSALTPKAWDAQLLGYSSMDADVFGKSNMLLLKVVAMERGLGMSWWDAGILYFSIKEVKLLAKDFSGTGAGIDSC